LILNRLHGTTFKESNVLRDYLYVDDLNDALANLLTTANIGSYRVVDFTTGNLISTDKLQRLIMRMTPAVYGEAMIESMRAKGAFTPLISPPVGGKSFARLLGHPVLPLIQGLARTIKFIQSQTAFNMTSVAAPETLIFKDEHIVGSLPNHSSGNLLIVKNDRTGKVFVRKMAVREGVEGNGLPKLKAEIRFLSEVLGNSKYSALATVYLKMLNVVDNEELAHYDMPIIGDGRNLATVLSNVDGISVDDFYRLLDNLLSVIVPGGYMIDGKDLSVNESQERLDDLYVNRVKTRVESLRQAGIYGVSPLLPVELLSQKNIVINGKAYQSPLEILNKLDANPELRGFFRPRYEGFCVHGDLNVLNILYDKEEDRLRLIDPRGVTGKWDPLYDFGKMKMGLGGFEYQMMGNYILEMDDKGYELSFTGDTLKLAEANERFLDFLAHSDNFKPLRDKEPYWRERILFSEAVHDLGDVPFRLHIDESAKSAVFSYLLGTLLLNQLLDRVSQGSESASLAGQVSGKDVDLERVSGIKGFTFNPQTLAVSMAGLPIDMQVRRLGDLKDNVYLLDKGSVVSEPDRLLYLAKKNFLPIRHDEDADRHEKQWRMDLTVYPKGALFSGELGRSTGHRNGPEEIEVFHVWYGKARLYYQVMNDEGGLITYYQDVGPGEYGIVPVGVWHSTHILEGPAVIGNITNREGFFDQANKVYFKEEGAVTWAKADKVIPLAVFNSAYAGKVERMIHRLPVDLLPEELSHFKTLGNLYLTATADVLEQWAQSLLKKDLEIHRDNSMKINQKPEVSGGIDLNASRLVLEFRRDGQGVLLPFEQQTTVLRDFDGFLPEITNITPLTSQVNITSLVVGK